MFFPSIFWFKCNCSDSHLAEDFNIFKEKIHLAIKSSCGGKHSCWDRHPLREEVPYNHELWSLGLGSLRNLNSSEKGTVLSFFPILIAVAYAFPISSIAAHEIL